MLEHPQGVEAAARLGKALAIFQQAPLEGCKLHSFERELLHLGQRVDQLGEELLELFPQAQEFASQLLLKNRTLPQRGSPSLQHLTPHRVLCINNRIAVGEVEKIRFAHPFLDVGHFTAQLTLAGIRKKNRPDPISRVTDRFLEAYESASNFELDGLPVFRAAALFRLACIELKKGCKPEVAGKMLKYAEQILERAE